MSVFDLFKLDGRVAIVTGGSRGLGYWISEALAEAGANVVMCARKLEPCQEAAKTIADIGVRTLAIGCDVTNPDDVNNVVQQTISEFGQIDILINNAGFIWEEPPEDVSLEKWNQTMNVNATGTFLFSQAAGRQMIKQKRGKIINIISVSGLVSVDPELSDTLPYSASKGAIVAMTRDLARKWCPHNITVNGIAPGYFGTKMARFLIEHRNAQLMNAIHMKRLGEKDDLKGVAVFLSSDAANYITGQVLAVDGGVVI